MPSGQPSAMVDTLLGDAKKDWVILLQSLKEVQIENTRIFSDTVLVDTRTTLTS